ncbi:MAG TPA: hypothetical protein VL633_08575 [Bacteroidota bacterium]|nr:hypothetical protein [Bacteroidota bacterium]
MSLSEDIQRVREFCKLAMDGKINFDDVSKAWPSSLRGIYFYDQIENDIFQAIEHFPTSLFTGQVPDYWGVSDEFVRIYLDWRILELQTGASQMNLMREELVRQDLSLGQIDKIVDRYLSSF